MKKALLILALLFSCQLYALDYYWVGGGGNWSELSHWRLGSPAGAIPSIIPSSADNVFFDANSGFDTATVKTVTLDANGFCNNMTWGNVTNNPSFITANAAFTVQISGNLSLSPTTTYRVIAAFKGAAPATLTTNGTVLGPFGVEIDKPGSSLTVTDSLIVPSNISTTGTNVVILTSGTFNISGKKVTIYQFSTNNTNVRTLDMANANFTANLSFQFYGSNKTLNAAGSTLKTFYYYSDGGTYNKVTVTSATGPNVIIINNSTFSALTFSPAASAIYSDIGNGNTVDTLIFNAQGSIGSNNTVGSVLFGVAGSMDGTGNVIRKITSLDNFAVSGNYTNTVDSVVLASNRTTQFWGTFNINKYLYVAGAPCEAFTEINGDSTAGTVNFAAGAVVDISNVILTGVKATGPGTPFAVNGIDGTGNAGFTITEPGTTGTTLYWVGGAGDWNNRAHWSTTSGGPGGACVPFTSDNVVFDANSGLTAGGTVTTSSSSFCKDMTWAAGVGTVTFNESATASFRVYGSVVLQPTVTLNAQIEFWGSSAATLSMNGGGMGTVQLSIYKTGSGSLTLLDNWSNLSAGCGIFFMSGNLNMAGRTVSFYSFISNNNLVRNLDISNATITTTSRWIYQGANKSITSTGSHITADWFFQVNAPGSTYPWVDLTYSGTDVTIYSIGGTTFGQLTFTSASATSIARIVSGNTIRRLEYKGAGYTGGSNTIDSLILAGSRNYLFSGTNTINKYFKAEATTCSGLTEIRGYPTAGALAFAGAAELHIANVYMQGMTATGPLTPIAFNGANAGGNTGWTINSAAGAARYWVGGAGDWNESIHWSTTSGGAPGACIPTVYDDVYFDAGSGFTAGNKTVTVNNGNAYARNVNWTGAANAPIWNKSATWNMEIWGDSIILNPAATFNALVTAKGATPAFLKGNVLGNFDFNIDKPGSSLTVLNDYNNPQTNIGLYNGALNASGLRLTVQQVDNSAATGNVFAIDIHNSTVIAPTGWRFQGTIANHTLNAANSIITTGDFKAEGMQYDTVMVTGNVTTAVAMNSTTINRLTFTDPSTTSTVGITGSNNTLGRVEYKGSGTITGTNNVMDTLIFFPGNRYTLTAGTNNTVNDAWYGSGTPCRPTEIVSSSTSNATLTKNGDPVSFDYVRLQRITAAGSAAPFEAQSHSTNLGNNVNWNIAPYNGAAPILGLGPDTAVLPANFPITLHTDGFFGAPGSQYTWNDNSKADTLLVAGPGTYSVNVSFPDGCAINDQIVVTQASTLPVTLLSFTGKQVDCQPRLDWKVADAINFSRFEVEKSKDGHTYAKVAELPYTGAFEYTWSDPAADNPTSYYRLKMVDIDEEYTYSNIIPVKNNCLGQIKVYPTVTDNKVQVTLPVGYERATIQVYNAWGQRMNPLVTGTGSGRTVHLQRFPKATYILQVINGTERKSFTIIKP
ncbi:T9SS type A sorting domain-containing protein [Pseudoflavitalea sp. X16]|uniref:T9SS type A sorting domain-containing protein n=1 Tax=Paraflavitalea devenefica TaxID=2716334 RepID=UPI0014203E0E|nr:T9SS type A sorting domain-containing protein [Paraflavitalea devenefica]NII29376.1 T9SS type A sorting domain-containing protein [Paraflavitalea devenefica]